MLKRDVKLQLTHWLSEFHVEDAGVFTCMCMYVCMDFITAVSSFPAAVIRYLLTLGKIAASLERYILPAVSLEAGHAPCLLCVRLNAVWCVVCVLCRQPGLITAVNGPNTKCRVRLDRDKAEKWSASVSCLEFLFSLDCVLGNSFECLYW